MNRFLLAVWISTALTAPFAVAQTQAINGTIRGRVTDPAGAPIPKAAVEAVTAMTISTTMSTHTTIMGSMLPASPCGSLELSRVHILVCVLVGIAITLSRRAYLPTMSSPRAWLTRNENSGLLALIVPAMGSNGPP